MLVRETEASNDSLLFLYEGFFFFGGGGGGSHKILNRCYNRG